jgi:hypothetical protein
VTSDIAVRNRLKDTEVAVLTATALSQVIDAVVEALYSGLEV